VEGNEKDMATMWKRALAYLGLVEEDYDDEFSDLPEQPAPRVTEPRPERSNVRAISGQTGRPVAGPGTLTTSQPNPPGGFQGSTSVRPVSAGKVHVSSPTTFNEAEEVGERFRNGIPVIMNLASASESVAKRMLDFAAGLIFGLDGRIERVGDRVFLLTPKDVDVSTEERRRLSERGLFNQA
jgi:cell division inhibitor SepF